MDNQRATDQQDVQLTCRFNASRSLEESPILSAMAILILVLAITLRGAVTLLAQYQSLPEPDLPVVTEGEHPPDANPAVW